MVPDSQASGDVGFLLGVFWICFVLWVERVKRKVVSAAENIAFQFATTLFAGLVGLVVYFVIGLMAAGAIYLGCYALDGALGTGTREHLLHFVRSAGTTTGMLTVLLLGSTCALVATLYERWQGRGRNV